jgi:hypothetical protein
MSEARTIMRSRQNFGVTYSTAEEGYSVGLSCSHMPPEFVSAGWIWQCVSCGEMVIGTKRQGEGDHDLG